MVYAFNGWDVKVDAPYKAMIDHDETAMMVYDEELDPMLWLMASEDNSVIVKKTAWNVEVHLFPLTKEINVVILQMDEE
ncbi:hypothetical protein [Jeotgalibacillus proteolyticus]|uniref:Uncharacterized protein n=1 Tax=Jeotgalibacillus proteolyticus TaxID=2082395 RepID=A0A2S5G953_9BACL|nr:hypothetical protein [Jeotgalibacillus proteolyticus]PPA69530.1 hypothetical protein C4B60_13345 [Jeotgalibacillus proteolyticus]